MDPVAYKSNDLIHQSCGPQTGPYVPQLVTGVLQSGVQVDH